MRNALWIWVCVWLCACIRAPDAQQDGSRDAGADAALGWGFDAGSLKPPLGHLAQAYAPSSVSPASGLRPCADGGPVILPKSADAAARVTAAAALPSTLPVVADASAAAPSVVPLPGASADPSTAHAASGFDDAGAPETSVPALPAPPPCAAQDPQPTADAGPKTLVPAYAGEVVITEIMADPKTLSDTVGEWFELYNASDTELDLQGCTLGDGAKEARIVSGSVLLAAHGYVAVARNAQPGFTPDLVESFSLTNTADRIVLTCQGIEIDHVAYDKVQGFPVASGASMQLDPAALDATENDRGSAWCLAKQSYGPELGTPGQPNAPCSSSDASVPGP